MRFSVRWQTLLACLVSIACACAGTGLGLAIAQSTQSASGVDKAQTVPMPIDKGQTQELGTLFFTPEERSRMDRQRSRGGAQISLDEPRENPSTINGFVKRSDAVSTVWVDNQVRYSPSAQLMDAVEPHTVGSANSRVLVRPTEPLAKTVRAPQKTKKAKTQKPQRQSQIKPKKPKHPFGKQ